MNPELLTGCVGIGIISGLWLVIWFLSWAIPPQIEEFKEMYTDWIQKRMFKAKEERNMEEAKAREELLLNEYRLEFTVLYSSYQLAQAIEAVSALSKMQFEKQVAGFFERMDSERRTG